MARDFPAGINDGLESASQAPRFTGAQVTMMAWIKPDVTGGSDKSVLSRWVDGASWGLGQLGAGSGWSMSVTGASTLSGGTDQTGVWTHLVGTSTGYRLHLYENSKLVGSSTNGTPTNFSAVTQRTLIGQYSGSTAMFDGQLAHIAVWRQALTPDEVVSLYHGTPPTSIRPADLMHYWPLELHLNDVVSNWNMSVIGNINYVESKYLPNLGYSSLYGASEDAPLGDGTDAADVYIDLQVSSTDEALINDSATIYVDLQVSATDTAQFLDTATAYVDVTLTSFECHIRWQPTFTADFLANWSADDSKKWTDFYSTKWSATLTYGTVSDEC
jgi:hypothetical protein